MQIAYNQAALARTNVKEFPKLDKFLVSEKPKAPKLKMNWEMMLAAVKIAHVAAGGEIPKGV